MILGDSHEYALATEAGKLDYMLKDQCILVDENDKAIATFQKLASIGNTHQHSKGNWYEALMHLKSNDREKAITALEKSAKNPKAYKHKEAKELIEEIKK